ncbi:WAT1-related At4g30420 [Olea europaea subsp. europaea]|uniref:WAT1-related protein n=1 Tax=Olea europaea subsp. europaea TaxID=158383 RepID=A0A8S0SF96_OLEEU|nr:WAT1-related At4g30420 [Olea europaea subsp. europaea]
MGLEDYKPAIVMVALQFIYAGVTLFTRAALVHDMSSRVFVVYRQSIAFSVIAPIAYFTRRKTRCCIGWKSFWMIFLLSLIGVTINQNVYFQGLYLSSSSVAGALGNLVPAVTFLLAYIMGLEKLHIRSLRSMAKIIGTIICVTGAVAMALLKGPKLLNKEFLPIMSQGGENWLLGCLFLFGSSCCWSLWLILQVPVSASYPDHLSLTAWMCLFAALQSAVVTLILEPDMKVWRLNSYLEFLCCLYAGVSSAVTFFAQAWCIAQRGPLFSAMFNPLLTVVVTVLACAFLHEEMFTGSLVGSLAVIVGLYVVLWGKAKENEELMNVDPSQIKQQSNQKPLSSESSDETSCRIDLEEPLLSDKSPYSGDNI